MSKEWCSRRPNSVATIQSPRQDSIIDDNLGFISDLALFLNDVGLAVRNCSFQVMEIGVHEFELFAFTWRIWKGMNVDMMGFGVGLHEVERGFGCKKGDSEEGLLYP